MAKAFLGLCIALAAVLAEMAGYNGATVEAIFLFSFSKMGH